MGKGKSKGKLFFSLVGFAVGAFYPAAFGLKSAIMGGLYGASLTSQLWSLTHKQKSSSTSQFSEQSNQISNDAMIPVIYGLRKFGGYQTWYELSKDKQKITKDIVFCEGEIDEILGVKANDIAIGSNPYTKLLAHKGGDYKEIFFAELVLKIQEEKWFKKNKNVLKDCSYDFRNGSPSQLPPPNFSNTGSYKHCAFIRAILKISEQLPGGNPTITALVKGKKVLDTRTNTYAWSDNPALCVRDYLLSRRYGLAKYIPDIADYIDEESFKEVADYCDELVDYKDDAGVTQKDKRYSLNIILSEKKNAIEHLADMFACFGGYLVISEDKLSLRVEKPTVTSYSFNETNIIRDSIKFNQISTMDSPNQYKVGFVDPNNEWTETKVLIEDALDQKEHKRIISKEVSLNGCTSQLQAIRMGQLMLNDTKFNSLVISFSTGTYAMGLEAGDVVSVTYKNLINDMLFRITEISEQNGTWNIKGRQYNPSIYNQNYYDQIDFSNYTEIPNPFSSTIQDVDSITSVQKVFTQKDGTTVSTLTVSWNDPGCQFFNKMIVSYSIDGGTTWVNAGSTIDNTFTLQNVLTDKTYIIKLQIQNSIGRVSNGYISSPIYITGKGEPPADVTNFSITQKGDNIVISFTQVPDTDVKYYEVRKGYQWSNGIKICVIPANFNLWTVSASDEGTMTFWIKAFNNSGGESVNPTQYVMNIIGLPKRNIILEEATTFKDWSYSGMYEDTDGLYLASVNKVSDYVHWADMFGSLKQQRTDAYAELPIIDLGTNILDSEVFYYDRYGVAKLRTHQLLCDYATFGEIFNTPVTYVTPKYAIETMAGISIEYNGDNPLSRVDYQYSSSLDLVSWSGWTDSSVSQFYGRYLKIRLIPKSIDGFAPVVIKSAKASVDVPDIEDSVLNVMLIAGINTVKFNIPFTVPPTLGVFVQDINGKAATYIINNVTTTTFDIQLLDGDGNHISGILTRAIARGY